jgi:gluconolactonase
MKAVYPEIELPPLDTHPTPGLLRVDPEGGVDYLCDEGLNAPNDLTVAVDGSLFLTDPGNPFLERKVEPRVMRWDGSLSEVARGFEYCNGIFALEDSILVTDHRGLLRLSADGSHELIAAGVGEPSPDGVSADAEGRCYVAAGTSSGVSVVEGGEVVEFLDVPGGGFTSNCAFGGADGKSLFATDVRNGTICVFSGMPVAGAPTRAFEIG